MNRERESRKHSSGAKKKEFNERVTSNGPPPTIYEQNKLESTDTDPARPVSAYAAKCWAKKS